MRPVTRDNLVPAGLGLGAMVLALLQRPGTLVVDTKLNLYTAPGRFLHEVASAWTPTADLGHVFGGQYGGYLFPMAPWFAAGDALGLPMWLVHRLWLGAVLAVAAWGVVRLLDALAGRPRGPLHVVAGALFVVNPYVAVYADRTTVALLAYAALPWMLLCVHRGLRDPRSWAWPAAFALVLTCTGGGVNAAVTGWVLVGPALFIAYERVFAGVPRGAIWPFLGRMAVTNALASAWWVVPILVHAHYGLNFLPFTEQPGTIWSTTSLPESLRLMGFWTSYIGVGFGGRLMPFAGHGHVLLFHPAAVVASLLVPALALTGFVWTRRWRYGPWFLLLTLLGLAIMVAGFPEGTPLRRGLTFTYNHVQGLQFLRTTYKAGPLVALGLACLAGGAFAELWRRLERLPARAAMSAVAVGLVAAAAWPLTAGQAPERQLALEHGVPAAWKQVGEALDHRGDGSRAFSLPGQLFSFYRWGGTIDHVLTGVSEHPVATRYIVPFADLRADDLQWAVDGLVSQERAVAGQLPPLLDLLGVGDVVLGSDGDRKRSGELGAADAADVLAGQGLLAQPDPSARRCDDVPLATCRWSAAGAPAPGPSSLGVRSFGRRITVPRAAGRIAGPVHLPRVVDIRTRTAGIVRLLPRAPVTVVDGGAQGIVDLAAFGRLDPDRPLAYAADLGAAGVRGAAARGADLVISDSNRRQAFIAARLRNNRGYVLPAGLDVSEDGVVLNPFPDAGTAGQTISELRGVRSLSSPFSPQVTQFPEHRPYAAMDGDLSTEWLADRLLARPRHYLDVRLQAARDVPYVDLAPYSDVRGTVREVAVNGRRFAVHRGWNRLRVGLHRVSALRIRMSRVDQPVLGTGSGGGIRELRIPGVQVSERLRPPVLVSDAVRGAALDRSSLTYLFDRFTADAPAWRPTGRALAQAALVSDRRDPEALLARTFVVPAPRRFRTRAWMRVAPTAPDHELDRLAGARGPVRADSSGRFVGAAGFRASRALDGDRRTAWAGPWGEGDRPWLQWRTARPRTLRHLVLRPLAGRVRHPTRVRVVADGRSGPALPVGPDGTVPTGRVRARTIRIEILAARFPPGTSGRDRRRRAVAIAEVVGAPRLRVPTEGPLDAPCLLVARASGREVRMRPGGDVADLDAGRALPAAGCGVLPLADGRNDLVGVPAPLVIDHLELRSAAPDPLARTAPAAPGRVLAQGDEGSGSRTGVRVAVRDQAWLVLGESYNAGWRAKCDGRDLGAPTPLQGYANGWRVRPGCRRVAFTFAPDRLLLPFYLLSAVASLGFLVLLLLWRRRLRAVAALSAPGAPLADPDPPARWPVRAALAAGVATFLVVGFVFALRAGAIAAPVVALLAYRGVRTRTLILAAGAALVVVVPLLYLLFPGRDRGGFSTQYAVDHLGAHWVAVGAFVLLAVALVRTLSRATGRGGAAAGPAP